MNPPPFVELTLALYCQLKFMTQDNITRQISALYIIPSARYNKAHDPEETYSKEQRSPETFSS